MRNARRDTPTNASMRTVNLALIIREGRAKSGKGGIDHDTGESGNEEKLK